MESERVEAIEACRTCGIFYMTSSNYLKHLFQSPVEQPDMMLIRLELAQWKVEVAENDGLPQYVCSTCIHEFHKMFKFRAACIETQEQFKYFCSLREENRANIKIKTERTDPDEDKNLCDFIYVDDLSDTEYDGATPFNIPHVPIKEEIIEAATVPIEEISQTVNILESASNVVNSRENPVLSVSLSTNTQNEIVSTNTAVVTERSAESIDCKLCQNVSHNSDEHKQHLQKTHEVKDMECHICGKEFKNATSARLKFHMKWHTLNKHVKCTLCGFVCNSKDTLKEHKRANHNRINCKICGKAVLAKKMKAHIRNHELLTTFPCEYCTKIFSTEDERENHIWQLHANEGNNFETEMSQDVNEDEQEEIVCQDSLIDLLSYKFLCAHCDERFIEQIDLESHVNARHRTQTQVHNELEMDTPVDQETSDKCDEMSDNEMDNHDEVTVFEDYGNDDIQTDHEQHPNGSELVGDSILGENQSPEFVKTPLTHINPATYNEEHEEENDEICHEQNEIQNDEEDGHSVSSEYASGTELKESTDVRPFACAKCTETFANIEQLRQHYERHLEPSSEQQREQNLHNKSKFKCHICGKLFDLKFSLNRHVKKHKHSPL